ncbi:hypothetical protein KKB55_05225 [Myxococcota bacterium]|nr:hypothetical protein [Myxococcota bacterium]MBU1897156.1 hypothetical protein [Myxococcota bacterium]
MSERRNMHLYHGGHKGAEAEFGRAALRWSVAQTTISYNGHQMDFAANVEELSDEHLEKGQVSMEFVFQALGRRFAHAQKLRRVINSMFHVVTRGKESFAIGWILPDNHVRGGTGWGVELSKFFNRPVHVFDQERKAWYSWENHEWVPSTPRLPNAAFSATGTRHLTEDGEWAIHDLFERSLGALPASEAP